VSAFKEEQGNFEGLAVREGAVEAGDRNGLGIGGAFSGA
jgi:hypothetical protein